MAGFFQRLFGKGEPHVVTIMPLNVEVSVQPSQTLLEAALAQGVAFPHNCTVGTCASCKCRLTSGQVKALTDFGYTLSKEELSAGYILACQARLKSAVTVEIESQAADIPAPEHFDGRIQRIVDLTHDIKALSISLDHPMNFVAGQYANIRIDGLPARSYSFATAPDRGGRKEVTFFIRKVPGGLLTEKLFSGQILSNDVAVDGPHGTFYLRQGEGPILCIAGGSGLAPLLSLLQFSRKNRTRRPCTVLFGARTQKDLYALDQIEEIGREWLPSFKFLPVLSNEPEDSSWQGLRGLVTSHLTKDILKGDGENTQAYMCGPPPMIDAAITTLTELGIALAAIHYDKFTDASFVKH